MAGSPLLPWLAAIMTTRMSKEPVPLTEDDNREVLMKIECRSNLRSNTDTILFQVSACNLGLSDLSLRENLKKFWSVGSLELILFEKYFITW